MSARTLELDSNSFEIDQTLTPNLNNLTLNDSTGPTTDGWDWDQDEFVAKSEENKGYNEAIDENWGWGEQTQKVEENNALSFPIRRGVPDCSFYLKTGSCKFGLNCRFNHPANVTRNKPGELSVNGVSPMMFGQTNAENAYNGKKWVNYSGSNGQIDCKYYSTPGGCKYGSACKFSHKEKNDHQTELNFVGLPVRPGEKECAYYMNTGSCKYSTNCRYHHPEPTAVGARAQLGVQNGRNDQHYSSPAPQNGRNDQRYSSPAPQNGGLHQPYALQTNQKGRPQQPYASPAHQNGGSQQPYALQAHHNGGGPQQSYGPPAQMPMAPWSLRRNPNEAVPYANTSPSYATTGYYVPQQGVQSNSEWNGYQAPANQMQSTEMNKPYPPTSHKMNNFATMMGPDCEYPERPGQQECQYFMKTGDCKFKAACRYDHPKHRQQASEVMLSPAGLPLRPDQPLCVHFSRHGICKFGRNCRYHHPADLSPPLAYQAENNSFSYSEDVKNETNNGQVQQSGW